MSISEFGHGNIDLDEAARQLEQAAHDAQVAYDSLRLGDLDWAHTNAVTARAEADAAENVLRALLGAAENTAEDGDATGLRRLSRKLRLPTDSPNPAAAHARRRVRLGRSASLGPAFDQRIMGVTVGVPAVRPGVTGRRHSYAGEYLGRTTPDSGAITTG